jgi:hypothetical protein
VENLNKTKAQLKAKLKALEKQGFQVLKEIQVIEEVETGDRPSPAQAKLIATQKFSYGVHFERRKELVKVKSPGYICVSSRRFTSSKEATQHGKRFMRIHRHKGFDVVRVNKRANAWINWKTGKTNPTL